MIEPPIVLGVNRTQDASLCLMRGSSIECAIQKERLTRQKHHWGRVDDFRTVYRSLLSRLDRPVDVLVECYSSDAEIANLAQYEDELAEIVALSPDAQRARISHHLAHLYSVFPASPFSEAAVMIVDGQGSPASDIAYPYGNSAVPGDWCEVSSFYRADRTNVTCLGKHFWNRDEASPVGLGMFYFLLTNAVFGGGQGNEGKVMGLAPHGDPRAFDLPPLDVDGCVVTIPQRWLDVFAERPRFRYANIGNGVTTFEEIANLSAAGQRAFEDAVLEVARWLHARSGADDLCFAGGTALNVSANERIVRETPFKRVFIPPAPSDAGTSLGCALYGLTQLARDGCQYRWEHDFLGPEPDRAEIDDAVCGAGDLVVETPLDLLERVVDLLCATKVVAVYQGRSEFGPRALGHRSIIGDPRYGVVRDWINAKVKEREWFRPLAPIVLLEKADRFFDLRGPSPFMQFAAPVLPDAQARIPAVTHVDGTARLQTVGEGDDPFVRELLRGFEARTGIPVLLNTSFNRREEPIVETPSQAIESFRRTPLHALVMPPYLIRKPVEPDAIV